MSRCIKAASTSFPSMIVVAKQPAIAAMHIFHKHVENDASDCRSLTACNPPSASSILRAADLPDRLVRVRYCGSQQIQGRFTFANGFYKNESKYG